jgi:hypothetical protein
MVIVKNFRCFRECDPMFLLVLASFLGIPFEYQHGGSDGNLTSCSAAGAALTSIPRAPLAARPHRERLGWTAKHAEMEAMQSETQQDTYC